MASQKRESLKKVYPDNTLIVGGSNTGKTFLAKLLVKKYNEKIITLPYTDADFDDVGLPVERTAFDKINFKTRNVTFVFDDQTEIITDKKLTILRRLLNFFNRKRESRTIFICHNVLGNNLSSIVGFFQTFYFTKDPGNQKSFQSILRFWNIPDGKSEMETFLGGTDSHGYLRVDSREGTLSILDSELNLHRDTKREILAYGEKMFDSFEKKTQYNLILNLILENVPVKYLKKSDLSFTITGRGKTLAVSLIDYILVLTSCDKKPSSSILILHRILSKYFYSTHNFCR